MPRAIFFRSVGSLQMVEVAVERKRGASALLSDPFRFSWCGVDRLFHCFAADLRKRPSRRKLETTPIELYGSSSGFWSPVIEITELDKSYKLTAALPGLNQADIGITVTGDTLTLQSDKRYKDQKDKDRRVANCAHGSFRRCFKLLDRIDCHKITADLSEGVLTIVLPKSATAQKPGINHQLSA